MSRREGKRGGGSNCVGFYTAIYPWISRSPSGEKTVRGPGRQLWPDTRAGPWHAFCKGPRLRKINPPRIERIERIERMGLPSRGAFTGAKKELRTREGTEWSQHGSLWAGDLTTITVPVSAFYALGFISRVCKQKKVGCGSDTQAWSQTAFRGRMLLLVTGIVGFSERPTGIRKSTGAAFPSSLPLGGRRTRLAGLGYRVHFPSGCVAKMYTP